MNELTPAQRERILERLRDGHSLRSIEAETGHRRETIGRYGREAGLLPPLSRQTLHKRSAPSAHARSMRSARFTASAQPQRRTGLRERS